MTVGRTDKNLREGEHYSLLVGPQSFMATVEISVAAPKKAGNRSSSRPSYATLAYIPTEFNILLERHLLNYFHCCSIRNSQTMEIA